MVDVPHVQGELLLPGEGVAPVDLRPAGDAGEHFVAARLLRGIALEVGNEEGARTNKTHLPFEDIDQFRKLIQAGGAQEAPEAGEALLIGEQVALCVTRVAHGAEFVEAEYAAVQPGARLAEDHRPAEEDADKEEQHQKDRGKDDQQQNADEQVKYPF